MLKLPVEVSSISCPFTGLNDSQLGEFAATFKSLNGLELGANPLTDAGLQRLSELQSLRALDVSDTRITVEGLAETSEIRVATRHTRVRRSRPSVALAADRG